jgi:hypothetical protein
MLAAVGSLICNGFREINWERFPVGGGFEGDMKVTR